MEALGYPCVGITVNVMFAITVVVFEVGRGDMVAVKLVMLETLEKDPVGPAV